MALFLLWQLPWLRTTWYTAEDFIWEDSSLSQAVSHHLKTKQPFCVVFPKKNQNRSYKTLGVQAQKFHATSLVWFEPKRVTWPAWRQEEDTTQAHAKGKRARLWIISHCRDPQEAPLLVPHTFPCICEVGTNFNSHLPQKLCPADNYQLLRWEGASTGWNWGLWIKANEIQANVEIQLCTCPSASKRRGPRRIENTRKLTWHGLRSKTQDWIKPPRTWAYEAPLCIGFMELPLPAPNGQPLRAHWWHLLPSEQKWYLKP